VSLAETYLSSKPKRFYVSFDGEIVIHLYYVLWKCKDGAIRRRAIKLLDEHPRREGAWDSWDSASVGRWVLSLEERQRENVQCREIKEGDRLRLSKIDHDTVEGQIRTWAYQLRNGERVCLSY
jgi:hypothetical protein